MAKQQQTSKTRRPPARGFPGSSYTIQYNMI